MDKHPDVWPCDEDAKAALGDPEYRAGLERFDRDLETLTGELWRKRYMDGPGVAPARMRRV